MRKAKESPMMIAGLLGCITVCGIGAYKFKNRGDTKVSVFLMQLRVAAQGTVAAALTLGVALSLGNKYLFKQNDAIKNDSVDEK